MYEFFMSKYEENLKRAKEYSDKNETLLAVFYTNVAEGYKSKAMNLTLEEA